MIMYNFEHGAELMFQLARLERRDCKVRQKFIVAQIPLLGTNP